MHFPTISTVFRGALCGLALLLTSCDNDDVHRATLKISDELSGELYWFDRKASDVIILMTSAGNAADLDMASALAWPDRMVAVLSETTPAGNTTGCRDMLLEATKALEDFAHNRGFPALKKPLVIGLDGAGRAAAGFADAAAEDDAKAVIAGSYCPGNATQRTLFCDSGRDASAGKKADFPFIVMPDEPHCTVADLKPALAPFADARAIAPVAGQDIDLMASVVSQILRTVEDSEMPSNDLDLPLIELPVAGKDRRLAIIYSGDGGWTDIDKRLGEELSERGIAVVGLDSLKYFWQRVEPGEAAGDLARIIAHYKEQWHRDQIMLIGYSFGADALPILWKDLPQTTRDSVSLMALLGLSRDASFEITVAGWVGVTPREAVPTLPAIQDVAGPRVLCIYGTEDTEDPCPHLDSPNIEAVGTPGGHHFDESYKKVADTIISRFNALQK